MPIATDIVTSKGVHITEFSTHMLERMAHRNITVSQATDALKNPLHIKPPKIDSEGRISVQYIGKDVTVAVNPDNGKITTTFPTKSAFKRKYGGVK